MLSILRVGSRGQDIKNLQRILGITSDGIFGRNTETAVKDFQKKNGLVADGIVGKNTWSKLNVSSTPTNSRKITRIIHHCTAGWADQSTESIKAYWKSIGWKNVGYHYLVNADGSYEQLADESVVTNGVQGYNSNSIHICYKGGIDKVNGKIVAKDTRTPQQKETLKRLTIEMKKKYPNATIHGHNEFSNKACPSYNVKEWIKDWDLGA